MAQFVDSIHIVNFKSVKDVTLTDCRRINLLIGKPNVGKSNLLEAMSLFCLPYLKYLKKKEIQQFVRVENAAELFCNGNVESDISVEAGDKSVALSWKGLNGVEVKLKNADDVIELPFSAGLAYSTKKTISEWKDNGFRSYFFPSVFNKEVVAINYLLPPSGGNLMNTVTQLTVLKDELAGIFHEYGLKYVFDTGGQEIKVMKENGAGEIFLIPFVSLADTLQRLMFYKAAILSNSNCTLLLEEPEAHTYPPYITNVVQNIIDSEHNQFFVTTHSPYIVNALLELPNADLAIYFVDMTDGLTSVKRATDAELQDMYENGIDLFFNIEKYLK